MMNNAMKLTFDSLENVTAGWSIFGIIVDAIEETIEGVVDGVVDIVDTVEEAVEITTTFVL